MKKRLLSIFAMAIVALSASAAVGDDLTSKYLTNADFTADTPLHYGVTTYAKDAAGAGTTLSGMQPVTGWTASNPYIEGGEDVDARACGVFELGKQYVSDYTGLDEDMTTPIFLGGTGFITPAPTEGKAEGNVLGMCAVWGATVQYTQAVTLPAGTYEIIMPVYNNGGAVAIDTNLYGFIADDGTKYCASATTWTEYAWTEMKVSFTLDAATTGVISVGYHAANSGSASMPHLYLSNVQILEGDPVQADIDKANELKPSLLALIEEGNNLGADTSASQAVYDNPTATLAEVEAAIENQKAINDASQTDLSEFFIKNPHFNQDTALEGGVTTYDYDRSKNSVNYYGMQPVKNWTANHPAASLEDNPVDTNTGVNNGAACGVLAIGSGAWIGGTTYTVPGIMSDGTKEGNVLGFVTCWSFSTQYTQAVTIPAGKYTLTISYYNTGGTQAVAKNLMGFIADDGTEYLASTTTFVVGSWEKMRVSFELDEPTSGVFSVGYTATNTGSGNMPHFYIDGISLNYVGESKFDPSLFALQAAVTGGQTKLENNFNSDLKSQLQDAVDAGEELVLSQSSDKEANVAAAEAINSLLIEVNENIAAYKSFQTFLDGTYSDAITEYDANEDLADFAGELADDKDNYQSNLDEGVYTTAQINEIIDGFTARCATAIKSALDKAAAEGGSHNIPINALYADQNLDFANSTVTGWSNETGTSAFLSRVQTAEVWNQASFNVYQTLKDLPAGVYELQVPGFYRSADNATNYAEYTNGEVVGSGYIYCQGAQQLMHNVAEDQYLLHASESDGYHDAAITDGELYVVNSNNNAHHYFYDQTEADVWNTVTGALAAQGDLTIGVKGENLESNAWVVWGGVKVIYKGTEGMEAALYAQMQQLVEKAQNMLDDASAVAEADNELNEALSAAESTSDTDKDEIIATINQLQSAIDYANQAAAAVEDITEVYTLYNDYLVPACESGDENFITLLEQISTCLEDGFENIEQIQSLEDQIPAAYGAYVQYDHKDATEQNPGDISAAIINRGFEGAMNDQTVASGSGDGGYWTKSRVGGNDFGYQAGVYESWNTDTFDIHQTIQGLQAGYYRIRVQSFFRANTDNQTNADEYAADTTKCAAYLYANAAQKQIRNQVDRGDDGAMVGSDGNEVAITYGESTEYYVPTNRTGCAAYFDAGLYWNELDCQVGTDGILTLGIKKESHVYGDWCPFDNFQLLYLGTTAPTAVESIEAETPAAAGKIYDLSGRQVSRAQRGIYIVNGKKVIK